MMTFYFLALAVASVRALILAAHAAWLAMPDRWRYRVRLAARRLYIVGPLAASALAGCDAGGLLVVNSGSGGSTSTTATGHGGAGGAATTTSTTHEDAGGDAPLCTAAPCPVGSYSQCEPGDETVTCCQGSDPFVACSRPAGVLLNHGPDGGTVCPASCGGAVCALSPMGTITCCGFSGTSAGACDKVVP